jgi:hypothetical protein
MDNYLTTCSAESTHGHMSTHALHHESCIVRFAVLFRVNVQSVCLAVVNTQQ